MDKEYYEMTSELDAREILRYLNNLGIHNISGEVLKYFITDLKKLIKYDLENRYAASDTHEKYMQGPERLHSASTFSSRSRSRAYNGPITMCSRECQNRKEVLKVRTSQSAPNLPQQAVEKPVRRACSCIRVERKPESRESASLRDKVTVSSNNNLIKVPVQAPKKKCDPVSLYHYYTSLWARYKPNVPGENDWADLRWKVRQKMAASDIPVQNKDNRVTKNRL